MIYKVGMLCKHFKGKDLLEKNITEGSLVIKKGDKYFLDKEKTAARRKKIAELQNSLFEN